MPYIEKLKMIKDEKGLTNKQISDSSDVPLPTVIRVFNENTLNPSFETIVKIAIGMGVSLDELVGLKQPDEPPLTTPIESTINSLLELIKEKDDRIKELKEDKSVIRNEKYKLVGILVGIIAAILILFTVDIFNGHFGYFIY